MVNTTKLVRMEIRNLGCIGNEGLKVELDNILCLVGPNNSGKSTVLRAYELAVLNGSLNEDDKCKFCCEDEYPEVVLSVHIPKGIANIDEKWKVEEGEMLLVKSKWTWESNSKPIRSTWDPEIDDYSVDQKASGLDTVFSSRLPQPFRIGALEDPTMEHKKLLTLILQPISEKLSLVLEDEASELAQTIGKIKSLASDPINNEEQTIKSIEDGINATHNEIFPNMSVDLDIGIGSVKIEPLKLLQENSKIKFSEWDHEIDWKNQGTGSQRALFWSMLQVRSEMKSINDQKLGIETQIKKKKSDIKKLETAMKKAKTDATKIKKQTEIESLQEEIKKLEVIDPTSKIKEERKELPLPGYMLLIDEPEVALHPSAVRAASDYLYSLAKDPAWQIILSTHSPHFINPLEDHTTIVRLERNKKNPHPRTYKSDIVDFDTTEKEVLKLLNKFDVNLAEMFFGQYPIIIEGDTEFAAFQYIFDSIVDEYPKNQRPVLIRARGKYTILSIMKILAHFKVKFSVLHDADYPLTKAGNKSSAWVANTQICDAIEEYRKKGIEIRHHVSIPSFEHCHLGLKVDGEIIKEYTGKEKPWKMVSEMQEDAEITKSVKTVLDELLPSEKELEYINIEMIEHKLKQIVKDNELNDPRIVFE